MPTLQLSFPYKKNDGLVISSQELQELYFYGIPVREPGGSSISQETVKNYILSAQAELEHFLNLKLTRQKITEGKDWHRNDWYSWGYIRTTYPVVEPLELGGFIGTVRQITYPKEWLSSRKTSDGELYHRHIHLVPNANAPYSHSSVVYSGVTPHLGFMGNSTIPNYWEMSYVTGFCKVPRDLIGAIGMIAALNLFYVMGDILLSPGVSSQSISIDGLSQNISTQGAFKTRIDGYVNALKELMPKLGSYYKGFVVTSM